MLKYSVGHAMGLKSNGLLLYISTDEYFNAGLQIASRECKICIFADISGSPDY